MSKLPPVTIIADGTFPNVFNVEEDLGLYPAYANFTPFPPKTYYVDIPGTNGTLDYTEVLGGTVNYGDGTLDLTFYVIDRKNFTHLSELLNINGRIVSVSFTGGAFAGKTFSGRLTLGNIDTARQAGVITASVNVKSIT